MTAHASEWHVRSGIPGNRVTLLVDGEQAFPAMLSAIGAARYTVVLESYIYAPDRLGHRFLIALVRAAERGVQVRVLIDGVGSLDTGMDFFAPLIACGGAVCVYEPMTLIPAWRRDHRKLLVVDGCTAFIGGLNIADAYAPPHWGGDGWHDMHARVEGPAAHALGQLVGRTWERVAGGHFPPSPSAEPGGPTQVQILESRLTRRLSVRRAYMDAIRHAQRTVRICNAYCIPDRGILRVLRNACARGVQVQLLLAGVTDVWAVQYASRALYRAMLAAGMEIYEWHCQVLHAKCAVIDGQWCSIGSYNMDRRSFLHNLEANIACIDGELGAALDNQFNQDIAVSRRVDGHRWHRRPVGQKILEQVFYKMRYWL